VSGNAFRPSWWLPGAHLQTVWGPWTRSRRLVVYRREPVETPDGDELILDHLDGPPGAPRVVLLHGLEGSSSSVYVQGLAARLVAAALSVTALNFRSCAKDPADLSRALPNRRPRLYHSGETTDLAFVVDLLRAREPGVVLGAAGISLGGNVLLKRLGEAGAASGLAAAATVSVPYDLAAGARHMESGLGPFYLRAFLASLKPKAFSLISRFPEVAARLDATRIAAARTFVTYDDAATAPLHGFAGADDYYERCSSLRVLAGIATPTLCLSAGDDPFLPAATLRQAARAASSAVRLEVTRRGGHVGFVTGALPFSGRAWAEERVVAWLRERL